MDLPIEVQAIGALLALTFALEWALGVYQHPHRRADDWIVEFISPLVLGAATRPAVVWCSYALATRLLPSAQGALSELHFGWAFAIALISDDLLQYGYHRASHRFDFLWRLHRAHHASPNMGVSTSYRNAFAYYLFMPNLWTTALLVYLGLADAVALMTIVKLVVVMGAHSELRWDRFLYRYRALSPLAWLIERTISTPATHFAHHGLDPADGVSAPNRNFSNFFFFWDVLFGTALITRRYPERFGLPVSQQRAWVSQLLAPLDLEREPSARERGDNVAPTQARAEPTT